MAIARIITKALATAANSTLICNGVSPVANTALTLSTTAVDAAQARRILVTYTSGEGAQRTLNIVGTNQFGNAITEALIVPTTGTTVYTAQDFLTVTSITPTATFTNPISVGTNGVGSSPWIFANLFSTPVNFAVGCVLTGTATYTVEYTYDNPNSVGLIGGVIPTAWPVAALTSKTANADGSLTQPFLAWRLTINSGTGSVTATGIQVGVSQ